MSDYFRTATLCDLSVAAKAPVPIYNVAPSSTDKGKESTLQQTAAKEETLAPEQEAGITATVDEGPLIPSDLNKMQFQDRMGVDTLEGVKRIRAMLDHESKGNRRAKDARDARVAAKESDRLLRMQARLAEEAKRNASLMESIEKERAEKRAQDAQDAEERRAAAVRADELKRANKPSLLHTSAAELRDDTLVTTFTDASRVSTGVDLFDKIRLEEERQLRHRNRKSGIIGMYNDLALTAAMEKSQLAHETNPRAMPKAFPSQLVPDEVVDKEETITNGSIATGGSAAVSSGATTIERPIDFIPESVLPLISEGRGKGRVDAVKSRVVDHKGSLSKSKASLDGEEAAENTALKATKMRLDRERKQMLAEAVTQDKERQRVNRSDRDATLRLMHPSTFADSYGPTGGAVVPVRPGVIAQHSEFPTLDHTTMRPLTLNAVGIHPIDRYQELVRAELDEERREIAALREARELERVEFSQQMSA